MSQTEPQTAVPEPERSGFQFSLQTLLLLFIVLGSSLAVFGGWGILVFALTVGLAVYVRYVKSLSPTPYLVLGLFCLPCLLGLLMPTVGSRGLPAHSTSCMNNQHEIMLALLQYESANGYFPPAYIADKHGKPMYSWRVLILPYLQEDALYKAYDFAEPWDSAKNKKLLAACPRVYQCQNNRTAYTPGATQTSFVAVVGRNAAWAGEKPRRFVDFAGATSNTVMLIEADNSGIQWTEPRDLSLDTFGAGNGSRPALDLSSNHYRYEEFFSSFDCCCGATVAMADGHEEYLSPGCLSTENLRKILQVGAYSDEETYANDPASGSSPYDDRRRLNWPNIAALAVWLLSVGTLLVRAVRSRKARVNGLSPFDETRR